MVIKSQKNFSLRKTNFIHMHIFFVSNRNTFNQANIVKQLLQLKNVVLLYPLNIHKKKK